MDRLKRLGFIEIENDKITLKKPNNSWLDFSKTSQARRNLQRKLHTKSVEAIENLTLDQREHSSMLFAVDPKHLPEIKLKMTEFRRSIDKYAEKMGGATEVYSLCVSLFPLTENQKIKINPKKEKQ
jgi:uncharacterized protein (TIGR02147 family)